MKMRATRANVITLRVTLAERNSDRQDVNKGIRNHRSDFYQAQMEMAAQMNQRDRAEGIDMSQIRVLE